MLHINKYMDWLHAHMHIVNTKMFYAFFSATVLLNPIAVWFQTYEAWTAQSTVGISGITYSTMLFLQIIGSGYSIRIKYPVLLLAMLISALGSIGILSALLIR